MMATHTNVDSKNIMHLIKENTIGAEIGVWMGNTSSQFLKKRLKKLYMVDPYSVEPYKENSEMSYQEWLAKYQPITGEIAEAGFKKYYDRKAQAAPLKVNEYTFLLNPKLTTQSDKVSFHEFKWEGPYKVVKVLSNSNYIIRKLGTYRTQCVHRMRLRPFVPNSPLEDVVDDPSRQYGDPEATDDQALFNNNLPHKTVTEPPLLETPIGVPWKPHKTKLENN